MTKQLIAAAKQRVQANETPFENSDEVLKAVFAALPEMKYEIVKRNQISYGIYEWDDFDVQDDEVKDSLTKAGFKFVRESADAMHFEAGYHFVVFAPNMGVVMVGSL